MIHGRAAGILPRGMARPPRRTGGRRRNRPFALTAHAVTQPPHSSRSDAELDKFRSLAPEVLPSAGGRWCS
ncbi:MAG: hypothetical protein H6Q79_2075 [Deltaproteobacteria bacterium]|nr:hypothetical protein [Deltaproteobacteria bacterium]